MDLKRFWDSRFSEHGHTGWSNPVLYPYDQKNRLNSFHSYLIKRNTKVSKFLDIGCGTGDFSKALVEKNPGAEGLGVDISGEVVGRARGNVNSECVEFIDGDISTMDLGENYDLCVAVTVLQHLGGRSEVTQFLRKVHASMAPSGEVFIIENIYNQQCVDGYLNKNWSKEKWKEVFNDAGFAEGEVTTYPHSAIVLVEKLLDKASTKTGSNDKADSPSLTVKPRRSIVGRFKGVIKSLFFHTLIVAFYIPEVVLKIKTPRQHSKYAVMVWRKC